MKPIFKKSIIMRILGFMKNSLTPKTAQRIKTSEGKKFDIFLKKHILENKDNLSVVLKSHLFIEGLLDEMLKSSVPHPNKFLEKKFSEKVSILEALGFFDSRPLIKEKIVGLNKLRNDYAHDLDYTIKNKDLDILLKETKIGKRNSIRKKLMRSLSGLMGYLQALSAVNKQIPFFMASARGKSIYLKDKGYNSREIAENYEKKGIKTFLENMKEN